MFAKKCGNACKVTRFYMVGDNPEGDIKGAIDNGWRSALVRTGLFKGPENDPRYPATFVEDDAFAAIQRILKTEGVLD